MRYGFSLFLGELIEANQITYGDCEDFQVVCASCSEPVFKGVRHHALGATHYLSHYHSGAGSAACENRVNSFSREYVQARNSEYRGQLLSEYLLVLPEELARAQSATSDAAARLMARAGDALSSPSVRQFLALAWAHLGAVTPPRIMAQYRPLAERAFPGKSPFWLDRQARLLEDILHAFLSAPGRTTFSLCLAEAVLLRTYELVGGAARARPPVEHELGDELFLSLFAASPARARRTLEQARKRMLHFKSGRTATALDASLDSSIDLLASRLFAMDYLAIISDRVRRKTAPVGTA